MPGELSSDCVVFILLNNVKMPTSFIYEKDQFYDQFMRLVEHEKSFITSGSGDLSLSGTYNLLFISSASLALIMDNGNNIENTQPLKKTNNLNVR